MDGGWGVSETGYRSPLPELILWLSHAWLLTVQASSKSRGAVKGNPSHPLHTKENHVGLLMFCLGLGFFFFLFNVELGKNPQYQGLIHSFQVLCEARACIICDCLTGCSKTSRKRHSINEKSSFSEAGDFFFFFCLEAFGWSTQSILVVFIKSGRQDSENQWCEEIIMIIIQIEYFVIIWNYLYLERRSHFSRKL